MLPFLILGTALLAGLLLAGRWYASANPRSLIKAFKWSLIGLVVLIAIFFLFTGRLGWAIATIPALIPWFLRARSMARMAKTFSRMSQTDGSSNRGKNSEVETAFLRMNLDHDSGDMTGEVLQGAYTGYSVEKMTLEQLLDLFKKCQTEEPESARLLEAYLDRKFTSWRDPEKDKNDDGSSLGRDMNRAEALKILGLKDGAKEQEIREAHRRLISGIHPDHGGSNYLAAQINDAKDVLLK